MEQATIEEIVQKLSIKKASKLNTFLNGMKYKQERSYSEEDMLKFAQKYAVNTLDKSHIEQFKKK